MRGARRTPPGARRSADALTAGTLCVYDTKPKQVIESPEEQLGLLGWAVMEMLRNQQP